MKIANTENPEHNKRDNNSGKKLAIYYGIWIVIYALFAVSGYVDSRAGHMYLICTGLTLAFLSHGVIPTAPGPLHL